MDRYSGPLDVGIPTDTETRLNIIYFFKASKTHNFSFSMPFVAVTTVVLASVLFWAITSLAWISLERQQGERLRAELKTAKSKLFEYQSRYDDVFGKTYGPESEPSAASEEEASGSLEEPDQLEEVVVETAPKQEQVIAGATKPTHAPTSAAETGNSFSEAPDSSLPSLAAAKPVDLTTQDASKDSAAARTEVQFRYRQKGSSDLVIDLKNLSLQKKQQGYQLRFNMVNSTGLLQSGAVKLAAYFDEKPELAWNVRENRYVGIYKGVIGGKGLAYSLKNLNSKAAYIKAPSRGAKLTKAVVQVISGPCAKHWSAECSTEKDMKVFELRTNGSQSLAVGKRAKFERVSQF